MSETSLGSHWRTGRTIPQFISKKEIYEMRPRDCPGSLPRDNFLTWVQCARVSAKCSSPSEPRGQKSECGAAETAGPHRVRCQRGHSWTRSEWEDESLHGMSSQHPWLQLDCTCRGGDYMRFTREQLLRGWEGIKAHDTDWCWGALEVWPSGGAVLTPPQ